MLLCFISVANQPSWTMDCLETARTLQKTWLVSITITPANLPILRPPCGPELSALTLFPGRSYISLVLYQVISCTCYRRAPHSTAPTPDSAASSAAQHPPFAIRDASAAHDGLGDSASSFTFSSVPSATPGSIQSDASVGHSAPAHSPLTPPTGPFGLLQRSPVSLHLLREHCACRRLMGRLCLFAHCKLVLA